MKGLLFLFLALMTSLYAGRTITGATLDGGVKVSVGPGETIAAHLFVTVTEEYGKKKEGKEGWASTAWRIGKKGNYTCVDHETFSGVGTYDETFSISAPFSQNIYDVTFVAYREKGCDKGKSKIYRLEEGVTVVGKTSEFSGTNTREFARMFQVDANGDVQIFGNTILGAPACTQWETQCWGNSNCKKICTKYGTGCPGENENNALINTRYFDVDNDAETFSSSSASLELPPGSEVLKAYLYWQGLVKADEKEHVRSVKLKTPNNDAYVTIEAETGRLNWSIYENNFKTYFPYQGSAEITSHVTKSGTYTVADLLTTDGKVSGLGTYGAWSIVVVYRNKALSLKNMTLYDGYDNVNKANNKQYTLSGFLTPANGSVNSSFLVFAGEGDVDITGDFIQFGSGSEAKKIMLNKTDDNSFNASITRFDKAVTQRSPSCSNNIGIDIHAFDVGTDGQNMITNGQSSVDIMLGSSQDTYFPSVFAFSTELYVPDVCYEETMTKNGVLPETIYEGDRLDVNVTIRNMSYEVAKGVAISRYFNAGVEYQPGSTRIDGLAKTDIYDQDTVEYDSGEAMLLLNIGNGATADSGGDLVHLDSVNFTYQLVPNTSEDLVSEYKVSYEDNSSGSVVTYDRVAIGKCSNRDDTSSIFSVKATGNIRVVARGKGWEYGNVKTQLAGKMLAFDLLYAEDSSGSSLRTDSPKVSKVELVNHLNGNVLKSWEGVEFDATGRVSLPDFEIGAYRELYFRFTGPEGTSNSFAVRPPSITMQTVAGNPMRAGETYGGKMRLHATEAYNQASENLTVKAHYFASDNTEGGVAGGFRLSPFIFAGAAPVTPDINYSDVGRIRPEIIDTQWVGNDRANGLCRDGSCAGTADANGLIGCDICGIADANLSFIPYRFDLAFLTTPELEDNDSFTYYSDDPAMSARLSNLRLMVKAVNKQGDTTYHYSDRTAGGYEKDIMWALDANISELVRSDGDGPQDAGFINGVATVTMDDLSINVGRNSKSPQNPLYINGNDVNLSVSVEDTDEAGNHVRGSYLLQGVDQHATFFYGRINPIDKECSANPCRVPVYYEVYCNGCDMNFLGMNGWSESVNDVYWYRNPQHPGSLLVSTASPTFSLGSSYDNGGKQELDYDVNLLGSGRKRVTITHTNGLQAPSYLYYQPYSDLNVSQFYIKSVTAAGLINAPGDVIENEGRTSRSSRRIGE